MDVLLQQIINGLVLGSMYALVALGYTMVYGIIGLINFAHGEVLMVGAMTSWMLIGWMAEAWAGLPNWVILLIATLIAMVVCAALNFTIEKLAYRPLRNSPRLAPLITAIGMSLLLQTLAMIIWAPNPKSYPSMLPRDPIPIGGAVISVTQIVILAVTAITLALLMYLVNRTNLGRAILIPGVVEVHGATITYTQILALSLTAMSLSVLSYIVQRTRLGRAMRATAENPRVAALMGIKPDVVISATFIIGAMLAAIAGVMWASNYGTVQHAMGFMPGLKAFVAAVMGGIGNLAGAVVGGIALGLIESLGAGYLGSQYQDIFAFIVLALVLTLRPSGLLGERVADRA